jgi:hypothetical protein
MQTSPSSEDIRASLDVVVEDHDAPEFQDYGRSSPIAGDDNSPLMPDGGFSDPCPSPQQVEGYQLRKSNRPASSPSSPAVKSSPPLPSAQYQFQSRQSKQRKKTGNWSDAALEAALRAVDAGGKVRVVARYFDIPHNSFSDHVHGKILTGKKGRAGVLTL